MCDIPSDFPHPISHTLLRVCVCHIEDLCHTRLSPLSPALYVFPEVRGRHLQVCIHIRMSHRGSMSHTPITLISRARCHVHMYAYTCVCNVECVCHIECVSHIRTSPSYLSHFISHKLCLCVCMCHIECLCLIVSVYVS